MTSYVYYYYDSDLQPGQTVELHSKYNYCAEHGLSCQFPLIHREIDAGIGQKTQIPKERFKIFEVPLVNGDLPDDASGAYLGFVPADPKYPVAGSGGDMPYGSESALFGQIDAFGPSSKVATACNAIRKASSPGGLPRFMDARAEWPGNPDGTWKILREIVLNPTADETGVLTAVEVTLPSAVRGEPPNLDPHRYSYWQGMSNSEVWLFRQLWSFSWRVFGSRYVSPAMKAAARTESMDHLTETLIAVRTFRGDVTVEWNGSSFELRNQEKAKLLAVTQVRANGDMDLIIADSAGFDQETLAKIHTESVRAAARIHAEIVTELLLNSSK